MAKPDSRFQRLLEHTRAVWDESALGSAKPLSRLQRFLHFWVLVCKSFTRNRCPVRASALAYATLLALIPMLAVAMSITSSFLKKEGEDRIDQFIVKLVSSVIPPSSGTEPGVATAPAEEPTPGTNTGVGLKPEERALPAFARDQQAVKVRKEVARYIHDFIQNTRSGTLGLTGSALLILAAISMLSRIETTFNDIWGVARGRSWFMRIVLYWGVLSLAPMLVVVALGLATGPHLQSTKDWLVAWPWVGKLLFQFLPVALLCLTFAAFYMLMPNTKVRWGAALVGGLLGGLLFHLNNVFSVLYVSRVVSNSKIYGSLGLVPVFMIGLYFAWLILLFGAQVAYAWQNRATYLEERQAENINQRGREFIALRLMTTVGQRFLQGARPPNVVELAQELCVPTRLVQQIMRTLAGARLVVETAGQELAYCPARPIESITCHDVLMAMRATHGEELTTRDEPRQSEVYGEFERIQEAERQAASSVTMLALVNRAQHRQLSGTSD